MGTKNTFVIWGSNDISNNFLITFPEPKHAS